MGHAIECTDFRLSSLVGGQNVDRGSGSNHLKSRARFKICTVYSRVQAATFNVVSTTMRNMEQVAGTGDALAVFALVWYMPSRTAVQTAKAKLRRHRDDLTEYLQRGALSAFSTEREEEQQHSRDGHRLSFRERARRDKATCRCVKCTAASIYQDLLHCQGGSVD